MSDDLISREALKKEFDDKCAYECAICKYAKDFAPCKLIDNAPTVERPQGERWIPVSERLPEGKIDPMTNDFELVLCSTVIGVVRPYTFGKPIGHAKAHFWSGRYAVDDYVIAWMPLPEPYKEAEND